MGLNDNKNFFMENIPPFLHSHILNANILFHKVSLKKEVLEENLYNYAYSLRLEINIPENEPTLNQLKKFEVAEEENLYKECAQKLNTISDVSLLLDDKKNNSKKIYEENGSKSESLAQLNIKNDNVPVIFYGMKFNEVNQLFVPSTHCFFFPRHTTLDYVLQSHFGDKRNNKIDDGIYVSEISKNADFVGDSKRIKCRHLKKPLTSFIHNKFASYSLIIFSSEN